MDVDQTFSKLLCRLCTFTLCPWFMSQSLPITLNPWSKYAIFSQNVPESGRYWRPHCQEGSWWMLTKPFLNCFACYVLSHNAHSPCLSHYPLPLIQDPNIQFLVKMLFEARRLCLSMHICHQKQVKWLLSIGHFFIWLNHHFILAIQLFSENC